MLKNDKNIKKRQKKYFEKLLNEKYLKKTIENGQ